ncbi:E3 SUMO-protein ligase SIZ1 [Platanthera guangdongensis]|uniref:E3 SUMO-protein ligase SIZ1 n=1 Tax=Platanthera guangdongensis TaxID=2320717 RepID=A0ABR2M235_9ASPA
MLSLLLAGEASVFCFSLEIQQLRMDWPKKFLLEKIKLQRLLMILTGTSANDLASKNNCTSDVKSANLPEERDVSSHLDMKIRCICSGRLITESMIQCEDSRCQVWQHIECVLIPDKPLEGIMPEIPSSFYCELCRLNRADPPDEEINSSYKLFLLDNASLEFSSRVGPKQEHSHRAGYDVEKKDVPRAKIPPGERKRGWGRTNRSGAEMKIVGGRGV